MKGGRDPSFTLYITQVEFAGSGDRHYSIDPQIYTTVYISYSRTPAFYNISEVFA